MNILAEAERIIQGDRERVYGDPGYNMRNIAAIWTAILRKVLLPGVELTAEQVCLCMAGVKLARLANKPDHEDSQVDLCGYTALLAKIQEKKDDRLNSPA
jgi:hypothetical protein